MKVVGIALVFLLITNSAIAQNPDSLLVNDLNRKAHLAFNAKEYEECRAYALQSLKIDSTFGEAYIIIGFAYIDSRNLCFEDKFNQGMIICLAVDMFEKAKQVDPYVTERADKLISVYSKYFPSKEAAFIDIPSGQKYKIGCWINEETTVRYYEDINR